MNRLQSLSARVREYLTPTVSALVSDLERKVAELEGASGAAATRSHRLYGRADALRHQADAAFDEASRANRIAEKVRDLIS